MDHNPKRFTTQKWVTILMANDHDSKTGTHPEGSIYNTGVTIGYVYRCEICLAYSMKYY